MYEGDVVYYVAIPWGTVDELHIKVVGKPGKGIFGFIAKTIKIRVGSLALHGLRKK